LLALFYICSTWFSPRTGGEEKIKRTTQLQQQNIEKEN